MMKTYKLSKAAEADIRELARYTLLKWGRTQSRIYKIELQDCLKTLAGSPFLGRDASEFSEDLLSFPYKAHLIFYKPFEEGIYVVRILSQRRNFFNLFKSKPSD